jgi:RNA polymerase sigma factor (sigma-70 family)
LGDISKKYSQEELLERILQSDEEAITHLYDNYYHSVRYYIVKNSGTEEDAKDIFQEVLVVLFQKLRTGKFLLSSSLKTYLFSVASILWYKELRKRRQLPVTELFDEKNVDAEIIESINKKEKLDLLRLKYEELSEDCKQLIRMYLNNIPIKEITALMGYSSDQHTKNRQLRCKKSLLNKIQSSEQFKELGYGKN